MKIYMVEWDLCEDVFKNDEGKWELDTCSSYTIEDQEFYTSKEVALERSRRLTYDYSHIWDDDEQKVVELDALQMRELDCSYNFPGKEVEGQNITIDDLRPMEEM